MTQDDKKIVNEEEMEEMVEQVQTGGTSILSLKLLPMTRSLQAKHGLRHGDYQRYRGYCSRRLARLRKVLKMVQGEKKRFTKKDVTPEILESAVVIQTNSEIVSEAKHLQVPLMCAERAWAYAMQLKFELNTEPRKKFHMLNRLRKAKRYADQLEKLCMSSSCVDARSKLEAQAFAKWMAGNLAFELGSWSEAMTCLTAAKSIYERLAATLSEDDAAVYKSRMDEIGPSLRYCAYNIGDASARQDLLNMRGHQGAGLTDLEELISQTREQQAATLQEVEWKGRIVAVKQEKVRVFLLREQEFKETEVQDEGATDEEKIAAYESLLMDCKDAIQSLRDDLMEDPTFKNRQQANEGPVSPMHFLHTYVTYIKCNKTIERNLVMIASMRKMLNGEQDQDKGKKPVKPQDLVRLYETIIQNLTELPNLAGMEEDLAFRQEVEAKIGFYKATRCYYIALAFMATKKWAESRALFQRATSYANKAKNDTLLEPAMRKEAALFMEWIEGKQFMAHANSILESEKAAEEGSKGQKTDEAKQLANVPLIDRLDVYYEDPDMAAGKPNLYPFPPAFQPIPCKPLFFDLAREHVVFPSIDSKMAPVQGQGQGGSGGWLGGWLGGWGAKK